MVRIPKDYHSLAGDRWPGNGRRCRTRDHEKACAARLKHSISGAISFAMPLFNENPYRGLRRVIDISGDGPNNNGAPVAGARDAALERGITSNGLPIMMEDSSYSIMNIDNLDLYYEDCVIGGPGSFAVSVKRRNDFKEAIRIKLVLEVAGQTTERRIVPVVQSDPRVPCLIGEKIWQQHELAAMNQGGRTSAGAILTEPQAHVCSGSN